MIFDCDTNIVSCHGKILGWNNEMLLVSRFGCDNKTIWWKCNESPRCSHERGGWAKSLTARRGTRKCLCLVPFALGRWPQLFIQSQEWKEKKASIVFEMATNFDCIHLIVDSRRFPARAIHVRAKQPSPFFFLSFLRKVRFGNMT